MENRVLGIVGANIHGLDEKPYYFDHRVCFAWDISFSRCPYAGVNKLFGTVKKQTNLLIYNYTKNIRGAV